MGQKECEAIAKTAAIILGIEPPEIQIKNRKRGRAKIKKRLAIIPQWAGQYHQAFWTYYVIHEVCHFRQLDHGPDFKFLEQTVCRYFDIEITYKRAYPKTLKFNGELVYG